MALVKEWVFQSLTCRILDGPFKNYNGYVAVPKGHPAWGKKYWDLNIDIHGGLTFDTQGVNNDSHWPDENLWWFGFDTSHIHDWVEYGNGSHPEPAGHRWTVEEIIVETERLAKQLHEQGATIMKNTIFKVYEDLTFEVHDPASGKTFEGKLDPTGIIAIYLVGALSQLRTGGDQQK